MNNDIINNNDINSLDGSIENDTETNTETKPIIRLKHKKNIKKIYKCEKCNRELSSKKAYEKHINRVNPCVKMYSLNDVIDEQLKLMVMEIKILENNRHNSLMINELKRAIMKRFLNITNMIFNRDMDAFLENIELQNIYINGVLASIYEMFKQF